MDLEPVLEALQRVPAWLEQIHQELDLSEQTVYRLTLCIEEWFANLVTHAGLSPDGKILVNTSETTNMAHFIDTASRQVVANVLVDARPRFAQFKDDGSELWVSSEIGGTVSVIDPIKHEVKTKVVFSIPGMRGEAIQPVGINLTRNGKTGFVALGVLIPGARMPPGLFDPTATTPGIEEVLPYSGLVNERALWNSGLVFEYDPVAVKFTGPTFVPPVA